MIYFALTPRGAHELLNSPDVKNAHIWCSADALSEAEFGKLERRNVTRFTHSFANADKATIEDALSTIDEHHPGERIWVESVALKT
jgi:hypothetical protein